MSSAAASRARSVERTRELRPEEVAWLAILPCALVTALASVLLAPPLGHALFAPAAERFWPEADVAPEPVEHARFLIGLGGPMLAAGAVLAAVRRSPQLRPQLVRVLVIVAQLGTFTFLLLAVLAQNDILMRGYRPPSRPTPLFTLPTLTASALLALGAVVVLRRRPLTDAIAHAAKDTRVRRLACTAAAVLLVLVWLSASFNTEGSVGLADGYNLIPWDMNETYAVLDGRTPLVDFHSQYAQLLPFAFAAVLRLVGSSMAAWTGTMIAFSAAALLAVHVMLRRLVGSALLALALFVPFLATSAFLIFGQLSPLQVFSLWPMRYGGPYVLAWLTARHLDGASPRRCVLLLAAGGVVAVNNLEFGLPALGGTLAALVWTQPPRTRGAALRLLRDIGAGVAAAIVGVCVLTLAHGGALPRFGLLLEFPRIYGIGGWVLEPMAPMGFHLAIYATMAATIVVATFRAVSGAPGRALTGMLVWSGVFGLGAASYYAGRSDPLDLVSLFSGWSLSLVLLSIVVVHALAGARRWPALPELAVLFGLGLCVCSIWQMPRPWRELARARQAGAAIYKQAEAVRLVERTTHHGQKIATLMRLGHRVAYDAGVTDVATYSSDEAMPTVDQLETTLDAIRRAGVMHVYVDRIAAFPAELRTLAAAGYRPAITEGAYGMLTDGPPSPSAP
jgi:hypothetical protein